MSEFDPEELFDKVPLVCCPVGDKSLEIFPDNKFGTCARCGCRIGFRPHAAKFKTKICMACAMAEMEPGDEILVTNETRKELRKQGH